MLSQNNGLERVSRKGMTRATNRTTSCNTIFYTEQSTNASILAYLRPRFQKIKTLALQTITILTEKGWKAIYLLTQVKITSTMLSAGGRGAEDTVLLGGSSVYIKMNTHNNILSQVAYVYDIRNLSILLLKTKQYYPCQTKATIPTTGQ